VFCAFPVLYWRDVCALMMKGGIDFGRNLDCEEAR